METLPMFDLASYFNDPLSPERSLQLNNRYWKLDRFQYLDLLREADDDINNYRLVSLRKSLRPIKALLPPQFHKAFVSRLVYSMVYRTSFAPFKFTLKLSDSFVKANSYSGPENEVYKDVLQTEELKYVVDLIHSIYRDKYGSDVLTSRFSVRYINSTNAKRVNEITRYGDFSDFHLDQYKDFTCIIYLCRVNRENGCFSYLDGTSGLHKSHLLRALHQVVTFDMGLSTPEQTSHLPLELRGGMGIGDFLDDDKRDKLRESQVDFVGNVGDGIIFNGFDTLHRGGKPVHGERTSVFISTGGHLAMRAKKCACQMLSLLWF
jgi:hypothetical protein